MSTDIWYALGLIVVIVFVNVFAKTWVLNLISILLSVYVITIPEVTVNEWIIWLVSVNVVWNLISGLNNALLSEG